jgi:hypothetical protein
LKGGRRLGFSPLAAREHSAMADICNDFVGIKSPISKQSGELLNSQSGLPDDGTEGRTFQCLVEMDWNGHVRRRRAMTNHDVVTSSDTAQCKARSFERVHRLSAAANRQTTCHESGGDGQLRDLGSDIVGDLPTVFDIDLNNRLDSFAGIGDSLIAGVALGDNFGQSRNQYREAAFGLWKKIDCELAHGKNIPQRFCDADLANYRRALNQEAFRHG